MTLGSPAALLIGALVILFLWRKRSSGGAVLHPNVEILQQIAPSWRVRFRRPVLRTLSVLFIVLLGIAAARPQRVALIRDPAQGRNLMLVLDLSKSMDTADYRKGYRQVSRLEAVKEVVAEFISKRSSDRIGLVVFGARAFLQCPLSFDHELLHQLLLGLQVGVAGSETSLGDALGLALKRVQRIPGRSKAIVLLTDGVNTAGTVSPLQAAKVARALGIQVHTVGIGSPQTLERLRNNPLYAGQTKRLEFDPDTLRRIAKLTGGQYFNARDTEALRSVYHEINRLEMSRSKKRPQHTVEELFPQFALSAFVVYLLYLLAAYTVFMRIP